MTSTLRSTDIETVVRGYFSAVADLGSTEDDLRSMLDPQLRVVEHPNAVTPLGAVRDVEGTITGFRGGKALLREQVFDVHEVLTSGERAAVRATWRGTIGIDAGPFRAGQELVAHIAGLLTVRDGRIVEHETFDCYEPFA
jgi:ketosteroid isomerase-like protein